MPTLTCPSCASQVDSQLANCPDCRAFVGYPNVRRAEAMRDALVRNHQAALEDAATRGVSNLVAQLKVILEGATATINVSPKILASMLLGSNYLGYHRALEQGLRHKAEDIHHAHRLASDAKLHPGYEKDIIYAALSPDGRGLTRYGAITLRLHGAVTARRASLLRENTFDFYERYRLGERDAEEDAGWRAVWADRALLGVAQLEPFLTAAISVSALPAMVLTVGTTRHDDRFIEVHVFDPISAQVLDGVSLDQEPINLESREEWDFASHRLVRRGISVTDNTVS